MAYYIIETCIGCTACTSRCPTDAITGERKTLHVIDPDLCIDCGACGVVCPAEAIYDNFGNLTEMLKKQQRPYAFVDEKACTGCDKCAERCPFDCLHLEEVEDPQSPFFAMMTGTRQSAPGVASARRPVPTTPSSSIARIRFPTGWRTTSASPRTRARRRSGCHLC